MILPMQPFCTGPICLRKRFEWRWSVPERIERFLAFASATVLRNARRPRGSVAIGFSANTCLSAATQAARWRGRKTGGAQRSTMSHPEAITFL